MLKKYIVQIIVSLSLVSLLGGCEPPKESVAEWQHTAIGMLDAAISQDGRFALVSSVNFGASYWDLESNTLKFQWKHNNNPEDGIVAVNLSPDGTRAITADRRTFIIWNTNSGFAYGYWQAPAEIRAVAIANKGRYVLLGLGDGRAIFIDMNTGRRMEFTGHRAEAVASVDLSANGVWAFTGGNDYRAVLWNTRTGKPRQLFEHKTRLTKLRLDSSGKQGFTSGTLGNAFIWDLQTGAQIARLQLNKREYVVSAARFSNDGKKLATGAPGRDISIWSTATGKREIQWRARTRRQGKPGGAIIYAVGFTKNDNYLLTESSAGYGEKWLVEKQ